MTGSSITGLAACCCSHMVNSPKRVPGAALLGRCGFGEMSSCHFLPQFLLQETLFSCMSELKDGKKEFSNMFGKEGTPW